MSDTIRLSNYIPGVGLFHLAVLAAPQIQAYLFTCYGITLNFTVIGQPFFSCLTTFVLPKYLQNLNWLLGIIPEEVLQGDFSLLWTRALYLAHKLILDRILPSHFVTIERCCQLSSDRGRIDI